jgi:hypothetical protein
MRPKVHWCDLLIGVAALWLMVSPMLLGYDTDHLPTMRAPAVNSFAVGAVLFLFCVMSAWRLQDIGSEILNIALGCWLVLSPYAFGFSDLPRAAFNTIVMGVIVIALAICDLRISGRKKPGPTSS